MYIRVVFLKLGEIDTLKENFAADAFIQARWREPVLDGKTDLVSLRASCLSFGAELRSIIPTGLIYRCYFMGRVIGVVYRVVVVPLVFFAENSRHDVADIGGFKMAAHYATCRHLAHQDPVSDVPPGGEI